MGPVMETQLQELPDNKVRLEVEVPGTDVRHAVDHAASDLAGTLRIPGFRKGKVPMPVLLARVGRDRLYAEAVQSHIGGWFLNAAARTGIRPVAQPEYGYDLPASADESFRFTATVAVQPKPEVADWSKLEVPAAEPEVPAELLDEALDEVRSAVAELAPVDGRPARDGDTVVLDLVSSTGETQRDYVVELGSGRLLEELEEAISGMAAGESNAVEYEDDDGKTRSLTVTVKEIKEKVLPPLDDDLARSASEFDTLAELRGDMESRLRGQLEEEVEAEFRTAVADALVDASQVEPAEELVRSRAGGLLGAFVQSLERRGATLETFLALSNQTAEQLEQRMLAEARQSLARELVLEAAAEKLSLDVTDEEVDALVRREAEAAEENPERMIADLRERGRYEQIRHDLRLRRALDRVAAEVKRIPVELARAREQLWTPGQERTSRERKLWTPGMKETP
jgi:trigger factor